jgi:SAM-dependent methyltransferase
MTHPVKRREWFEDWFDHDYAALYGHRDGVEAEAAVHTALRIAPELAEGPILDVGCGAGRHLAVLRRVNRHCIGLDLSATLLEMAPADLRPLLVQADMRQLPVRESSLAGVCLWFTSFGYFLDLENRALLSSLTGALRPGGVLLLDYLNARQVHSTLVPRDVVRRPGMTIVNRRSIQGSRVVKRITIKSEKTGNVREIVESVQLYSSDDVRVIAVNTGLVQRVEVGDYDGAPFEAASPRWIAVFQKS